MHTFGPLIVVEPRTLRPVVGRVATVTDLDGDPIDTYDLDGNPAPIVTGSRGQIGQFRADPVSVIQVTVPGGDPSVLVSMEAIAAAGPMADIIATGRLSEGAMANAWASRSSVTPLQETIATGRLSEDALAGTIDTTVRGRLYRGDLPASTNLDEFGGHGATGTWRISATDGHTGGPGVTSSGVLEVVRQPGTSGVLSVLQRVTDSAASWWREAIDYGQGQWGPWQRVATGGDLDQAVAGARYVRGRLDASDSLDTMRADAQSGTYWVLSNGDAAALGLPGGLSGVVTVAGLAGGSTGSATQTYTARATGRVYSRGIAAGASATWTPWVDISGVGALRDAGTLGTRDLNAVLEPGIYSQNSTGSATAARHYPAESRGFLTVVTFGTGPTLASQTYHATWLSEVWVREYYGGAWGPWAPLHGSGEDLDELAERVGQLAPLPGDVSALGGRVDHHAARITTLEGLSGDNPIAGVLDNGDGTIAFTLVDGQTTGPVAIPSAPAADQADYVHQAAILSPYRDVTVRRVQANRIEVSAVAPSGSHTTYLFRGNDDYLISSTVAVGDGVTTATVGPHSNKDFAMQVSPAGSGLPPAWVPHHGTPSAFAVTPPLLYDGDTRIDVDAMSDGQTLTAQGTVHLIQHVYGRHPSQPETNLIEVWTTHSIRPDGTMTITGRLRALADIELGSAYLMMVPVSGTFDRIVSSIGTAYPNTSDLHGTSTPLVAEADMATGYAFLDSARRDLAVAFRVLTPAETWRRGKTGKEPAASRAFVEHRNAEVTKLYQRPWTPGTVLEAGAIQRFAGEYLYLRAPRIYDALAL